MNYKRLGAVEMLVAVIAWAIAMALGAHYRGSAFAATCGLFVFAGWFGALGFHYFFNHEADQ